MEDEEESPQLKGFVIISLPPPDNPSLGKTITAFAISAQSSSLHSSQNQEAHQAPQGPQATQQRHLPLQQLPSGPQAQFSLRRFLFGTPRSSFGLVSVFIFALIFWAYASPQTLSQSGNLDDNRRDDDDEDKPGSFIFDLYSKFPKLGVREMLQKDIEVNLGKFEDNIVSPLDDAGVRVSKIKSAVPTVDSTTTLPVKGNIYPDGLYYTYILVGSPPRPYFLDIDTGSDLAWVQCDAPCTSCAKGAHPFYKPKKANIIPSKDSLCAEVQKSQRTGYCETCPQCDYEIVYADQSSSMGVLTRDELHLTAANGSLAKSKVIFGCAYDQQGSVLNSLTKTDGILGLSRAKVSLPSQLASQGLINNVIGHCLTADGGGGGYMFFGDEFVLNRKMEWVPMLNLPSTNSYVAEASSISYGNKQLSLDGVDNGHIIFDSGSSYTYFTKQAYSDLVARLQSVSANDLIQDTSDNTLPICWRAKFPIRSIQNVKQFFKPLTFQFGRKWFVVSMNMRIPPEGYLVVNSKGNVCLGILDGSEVQDGSTIILGDVSLRGQLVVYDNVKHRIGWTQSDCVKPRRKNS